MCQLVINSKKLSDRLKELGCMQAKTFKIRMPNFLENDMIRHFIRGYFDGDGSVGKYMVKSKKAYNCAFSIVSNINFLNDIKPIIELECNIHTSIYKNFNKNRSIVKSLNSNGNIQVYKFLDWIYKDSIIFLNRKYKKYKDIKTWLTERPYKKGQKLIT
jgi:intein/homing endonuclease